jgi:head-tail adaptor
MRAGKLRHRVTIDHAVDVQDSTTGAVDTLWTPLVKVWADIQPARGRERFTDGGILAESDTKITLRSPPGFRLTAKHRIRHTSARFGDTIYNVVDVPELGWELEVACKSGQNEG